ncbi:MAG: ABC transporter ATP-binding protein/permease [Chloroflexota bacterium]|nr:ABC transporter ATP-binding protein/permease [Chloroflexota bacterium]
MKLSSRHYTSLLATYLKPQWRRVMLLAMLLFLSIGLQLANPQIMRFFIDSARNGGATETLTGAALLVIGIAVANQFITVCATYVSENVGWTATNAIRADLARHCLGLDMSFHKQYTPGELIERIDGDVNALSLFFSQFVIQVLGNVVLMAGVLVMLFREDWRIGLALTIFAVVALGVLVRARNIAVSPMTADREAHARLFGFLEERLSGLDDIRANGAGAYTMRRLYTVSQEVYKRGRQAWKMDAMLWMIVITLFTTSYVLAFSIGAWLFTAGAVTLGTMYLFFSYAELLRHPLDQITDQLKELQKASAGIGRINQLMSMQRQVLDGHERSGVSFRDTGRDTSSFRAETALTVKFSNVSFGYGEEEMVLKDVSFRLEPGQVLGLLGRTGSGKTTVTRLLFRLYDVAAGSVQVDGVDVRDMRIADLRQSISMVTQDVQLFHATVRDNLTLFSTGIDDTRIIEALHELGLGSWYCSLPNGLDTDLGANGGMSAGEAQLLAFTRIFLKDPRLVILDEASSRLDPATETLIERAVDKLLEGRTGIIIAHRLGTVARADDIIIFDDGSVAEYGPRAELAADPDSRLYGLLRAGLEEVLV